MTPSPSDQAPDPLIGFTTDSLAFEHKLGEGGMGAVYRGRQIRLDRAVAIKVLSTRLVSDRGFLERFGREARLLARLHHPHVVSCYDFLPIIGPDGDILHVLVMELVNGCTIYQRACDGLSITDALDLYRQVAEGLAAAHREGVLHRDLKPDNILVTKDGVAKLVDFGLAKHSAGEGSRTLTMAGVILGTPAYMAPEVCRGGEPTTGADCYSLGCSLFHTLVGRPPFPWTVPLETIQHQINSPPPRPSAFRRDLTPLNGLISRLLAKDPDHRITNALALAEALAEGIASAPDASCGETTASAQGVLSPTFVAPPGSSEIGMTAFDRSDRADVGMGGGHGHQDTKPDRQLVELDLPGDDLPTATRRPTTDRTSKPSTHPIAKPATDRTRKQGTDRLRNPVASSATDTLGALELVPLPEPPKPVAAPASVAEAPVKPTGPSDEELRARDEKRKLLSKRTDELRDEQPRHEHIAHERLGDLRASEGRYGDAITAYQLAATSLSKPDQRVPIEAKLTHVKGLAQRRLLIRVGAGVGIVLAIAGTALLVIKPLMAPPATVATATVAPVTVDQSTSTFITALLKRAEDPTIPWTDLLSDANAVLPAAGPLAPQVQALITEATASKQRIADALVIIEKTWWSDPNTALTTARALRKSEPRLSASVRASLPLPARLNVQTTNPVRTTITIDGHTIPGAATIPFCRRVDRPFVIDVRMPGFESWHGATNTDSADREQLITASLAEIPLWAQNERDQTPILRLHQGILASVFPTTLQTIDTSNGHVISTIDVSAVTRAERAAFQLIQAPESSADRLLVSAADGVVLAVPFSLSGERTVLPRTAGDMIATLERTMTLRLGALGRFTIERSGERFDVAAYHDGTQLWRRPLAAQSVPWLAATDEQVVVIDDRNIQLFDQEGAPQSEQPLPTGNRNGPILPLARGAAVLIPFDNGLVVMRADPKHGYVLVPTPESLVQTTAVITAGDQVLAITANHSLALLQWTGGTLVTRWQLDPPPERRWSGSLAIGPTAVSVCDNHSTLHLYRIADHQALRTIELRDSGTQQPVLDDRQVIVVDTHNRITAYPLTR